MLNKIKLFSESVFFSVMYTIINRLRTKGLLSKSVDYPDVVISLTSYGVRLRTVYLTLESLLSQSKSCGGIVLYLSTQDIKREDLPQSLKRLTYRGVKIKFVEENLRSYKKLHYALQDFPKSKIITVDDDIIYPRKWLEKIVDASNDFPNDIIFYRGHMINFDASGKLTSYNTFPQAYGESRSLLNLPTGVSGILYPQGCFHDDVLDSEKFLELAPYADDLWYKIMSMKNNTSCKLVGNESIHFAPILGTQVGSLRSTNLTENSINNDVQLRNLQEYYSIDFREYRMEGCKYD
ncbi:TPA: hypothetical protein KDX42_000673 [Vibrio parahaemolyticus]|nr:hypothetical protein [Vibrio parahaemolyticus]EGQ8197844.1 hypothetical protein [Vibrio parahaemolyticus]ELA6921436.1 hypothetical protein [Vibrio parahaemolyticus]MCR9716257.1 hypothetical protein [Vibrio parahaemolyticus]MCX8936337.1 hypothetical protein [Vibrio parahaemolyticus]HBC3526864.1 hypothetical protein [Vibrio parahaemolyticus]